MIDLSSAWLWCGVLVGAVPAVALYVSVIRDSNRRIRDARKKFEATLKRLYGEEWKKRAWIDYGYRAKETD